MKKTERDPKKVRGSFTKPKSRDGNALAACNIQLAKKRPRNGFATSQGRPYQGARKVPEESGRRREERARGKHGLVRKKRDSEP